MQQNYDFESTLEPQTRPQIAKSPLDDSQQSQGVSEEPLAVVGTSKVEEKFEEKELCEQEICSMVLSKEPINIGKVMLYPNGVRPFCLPEEEKTKKVSQKCELCQIIVSGGEQGMSTHNAGKKHQKRLANNRPASHYVVEDQVDESLTCLTCNLTCPDLNAFLQHLTSVKHYKQIELLSSDLYCEYCDFQASSLPAMKSHLHGKKHKLKTLESVPAQAGPLGVAENALDGVFGFLKGVTTSVEEVCKQVVAPVTSLLSLISTSKVCETCVATALRCLLLGDSYAGCLAQNMRCKDCDFKGVSNLVVLVLYLLFGYFETGKVSLRLFGSDSIASSLMNFTTSLVSGKDEVVPGQANILSTLMSVMSALCPWVSVSDRDFISLMKVAGSWTVALCFTEKLIRLLISLASYITKKIEDWLCTSKGLVADWITDVDNIQLLIPNSDGTFESNKLRMAKFHEHRIEAYELYRSGQHFLTETALDPKQRALNAQIQTRFKKLESLIQTNIGSFVGAEGKVKPVTLYLHGPSGTGKTILVDHLYADVFHVLGLPSYRAALDKYTIDQRERFFAQYYMQRVCEIQDFAVVRDRQSTSDLIQTVLAMTDESSCPLPQAVCDDKGTVFFGSPFFVITSNWDVEKSLHEMNAMLRDPRAFSRRMDVIAHVARDAVPTDLFHKEAMHFAVKFPDGVQNMSWYEFVEHVCRVTLSVQKMSNTMTDTGSAFDADKLEAIRQRLNLEPPTAVPLLMASGEADGDDSFHSLEESESILSEEEDPIVASTSFAQVASAAQRTLVRPVTKKVTSVPKESKKKGRFYFCDGCGGKTQCQMCKEMSVQGEDRTYVYWFADSLTGDVVELEGYKSAVISNPDRLIVPNARATCQSCTESCGTCRRVCQMLRTLGKGAIRTVKKGRHILTSDKGQLEVSVKAVKQFEQAVKDDKAAVSAKKKQKVPSKKEEVKGISVNQDPNTDSPLLTSEEVEQLNRPDSPVTPTTDSVQQELVEDPVEVEVAEGQGTTFEMGTEAVPGLPGETSLIEGLEDESFKYWLKRSVLDLTARVQKIAALTAQKIGATVKSKCSSVRDYLCRLKSWVFEKCSKRYEKAMTIINAAKCFLNINVYKMALAAVAATSAFLLLTSAYKKRQSPVGQGVHSDPHSTVRPAKRVAKVSRARKPIKSRVSGQGTDSAGALSRMIDLVAGNFGVVTVGKVSTHCFVMEGFCVLIPLHIFPGKLDTPVSLTFRNWSWAGTFDEADVIEEYTDLHLVGLNLASELRGKKTEFKSMSRHLMSEDDIPLVSEAVLFTTRTSRGTTVYHTLSASGLNFDIPPIAVEFQKVLYRSSCLVQYFAPTESGDCGSPLLVWVGNCWKIAGLHVAGAAGKAYSGIVSSEWYEEMRTHLCDRVGEKPPVVYNGETETVDGEALEFCGQLQEREIFLPRSTKLRRSPISVQPPISAPAPLRGVYGDSTPMNINLKKSHRDLYPVKRENFAFGMACVRQELKELKGTKVLLDLEKCLFGEPETGLSAVEATKSVGWPWCKSFNRKKLVNLENRKIHPKLAEAFHQLSASVETGSDVDVTVVNMPKDERLPIDKVRKGKVRIFNILPFHVNLVLKKYFGAFCNAMVASHTRMSSKVGMSISCDDIQCLALSLRLGTSWKYLAGDIAAFDCSVPSELFFMVNELVNEWYGDQYSLARTCLVAGIFSPYHIHTDLLYRRYVGMPSGCYLTSLFNSLANSIMLYQACYDICLQKSGNLLQLSDVNCCLSLVTFGDDHVVAYRDDMPLSMASLKEWFVQLGIDYTNVDKNADMPESIESDELSFLKRKFVKRDGLWYFPLSVENIRESIQWYRTSASVKNMSTQQLCESLLRPAVLELYQHGEAVYNEEIERIYRALPVPLFVPTFAQVSLWYFKNTDATTVHSELCGWSAEMPSVTMQTFEVVQCQADEVEEKKQTTIGEVDVPVQVDQTLMRFTDYTTAQVENTPQSPVMGVDTWFKWDPQYTKALCRPFKLSKETLSSGTLSPWPFKRFVPDSFLLNQDYIWSRVQNATYIRYTIRVNVRVVATKFHYGSILLAWRPYFRAGLDVSEIAGDVPIPFVQYGAYDHVSTASQNHHIVISLTGNTNTVFEIGWSMPFQYAPLAETNKARYCNGVLDFYNLTPVSPSDIDPPELIVYANFQSVELYGYGGKLTKPTFIAEMVPPSVTMAAPTPSNWGLPESGTVAAQAREIADQEEWSWGKFFSDISYGISTVASIISPFSTLLAFFGLSRPIRPAGPEIRFVTTFSEAVVEGPSVAVPTTFSADNELVPFVEDRKSNLIGAIAAIPTYIGLITIQDATTTSFSLCPLNVTELDKGFWVPTPAAFIAHNFGMFRSAVKLTLCFYASTFVTARVGVSVHLEPTFSAGDESVTSTTILDVVGDTTHEVHLPFMKPQAWSTLLDPFKWYITLSIVSDVVSSETTEAKPIYCCVWASYPGMQVSGMGGQNQKVDTVFRTSPALRLVVPPTGGGGGEVVPGQAIETPPLLGSASSCSAVLGANDCPTSVLHIAKRFRSIPNPNTGGIIVNPWSPRLVILDYTFGTVKTPVWVDFNMPWAHYIGTMFRFWRTSWEFVVQEHTSLVDRSDFYTPGLIEPSTKSEENAAALGGIVRKKTSINVVRVPYRSDVPLLPTPIATCFRDGDKAKVASPYLDSVLGDRLFVGAMNIFSSSSDTVTLDLGAGDDLEYHVFIGAPLIIFVGY